jgi:superfamily II RNA helicase
MIPLLKEIVEILYTEGLLPVLLATETFALGVNAPTKTTVFTNLQKFDGIQKRNLYSEEYNQMAGRAGRRGLDTSGTIVILPHKEMISETMMHKVALAPPQSIKSRLELDYSVVIHNNDNSKLAQTLFYQQQDVKFDKLAVPLSTLKVDPQHQQFITMVQEVQDLEEKMKPDGYIRLDKKIEKKYKKRISELMRTIPENIYQDVVKYNGQQKCFERLEAEKIFNQERWGIQISMIHDFLLEQGFLCSKDPLTFSKKGIIMREIHDGNPLLMAEVLFSGMLDELPTNVLIAILSIFVVDKEREKILYSDLNLSLHEENCIRRIEEMAETGQSRELVLLQKLPFPFINDWVLSKTMYLAVKDWYDGHNWHTIKQHYGDFEGNFIKNILRLVNYLQCILNVAKLIQNVPLIQKLDNVQEKLVRDIVMNDSLYIQ